MKITNVQLVKYSYIDTDQTLTLLQFLQSNDVTEVSCDLMYSMHEAMNYGIILGKRMERQRRKGGASHE